jgi:hypothetical protein
MDKPHHFVSVVVESNKVADWDNAHPLRAEE